MTNTPYPLQRSPREGLVRPVRTDPDGALGPTMGQARGKAWRRSSHGFYVPTAVDSSRPDQRILEASMVLPREGGVTGWAGLHWLGGYWFGGRTRDGSTLLPVWMVTSEWDIREQPGFRVTSEGLRPGDVIEVDGVRVTDAVRSLAFEMRYAANVRHAVEAADMAAYNDLVSVRELSAYLSTLGTWTGIPQAREALVHVEENSWSPRETGFRLVWTQDAGLPTPLCNVPIFDRFGRHLGTPDLFDPDAGLVGEYNGAVHLETRQRGWDITREEGFRRHGLEIVTSVSTDAGNRDALVARIIASRKRALWLPEEERSWTIEPPPWWTPSATVEQRRSLSAEQRERVLRLRLRAA